MSNPTATLTPELDDARELRADEIDREHAPSSWLAGLAPLLGPGALSVADQAIVSAANFATTMALGRLLSRVEMGHFALGWSLIFFFRGVQEQVLCAPYMVHAHKRSGDDLARFSGSSLTHQLAFTLLVAALLAIGGGVLASGWGPAGLAPVAWTLVGVAPLMLLREFIRQLSFAHLEVRTALLVDGIVAVLQVGGLFLLIATQSLNVVSVYCLLGGSCGLAAFAWFGLRPRPFAFERESIVEHWAENWVFGRWTLAGQLLGSTTPYLLPWLLAFAAGTAETGTFAACSTLVGVANLFAVGLSNYLSHRAIHAYHDGGTPELRGVLYRTALVYAAALGLFFAVALLAGEWIVNLAYSSRYAGGGALVAVLSAGVLANSMGITAGNGLWAIERPDANLAADLVALVVTLAVAVLLVASWGALGAAWASCAGMISGAAVRWITLEILLRDTKGGAEPA